MKIELASLFVNPEISELDSIQTVDSVQMAIIDSSEIIAMEKGEIIQEEKKEIEETVTVITDSVLSCLVLRGTHLKLNGISILSLYENSTTVLS